jgi:hypothetical protein
MPLSVRLPASPPTTLLGMNELCTKHSVLDAYLWLSHKFPSTFVQVGVPLVLAYLTHHLT